MQLKDHVCLMAEYNRWMNVKLYASCATLSASELAENRRAFFGSIIGTLNHLVVADIIWLKRIAAAPGFAQELGAVARLPMPASLDEMLHTDLAELEVKRRELDEVFLAFTRSLSERDLHRAVTFKTLKGVEYSEELSRLLMHVFNHQTHHRGQATTLLSQAGRDVGVTDLLAFMRER